ncbi:hypothetical protein [Streptomyces sp. G45]|uniref:hypothetical protein n=1 Tax=Streptomyces sp. G45 TaxID=3406627 RepID=UPI003C1DF9F2
MLGVVALVTAGVLTLTQCGSPSDDDSRSGASGDRTSAGRHGGGDGGGGDGDGGRPSSRAPGDETSDGDSGTSDEFDEHGNSGDSDDSDDSEDARNSGGSGSGSDDDWDRGLPGVRADLVRRITSFTSGFHEDSGYRRPSADVRRAAASGVAALVDRRRERAERRLASAHLSVRTVTDSATGRRYAEVAEVRDRSADAASPRGWGRVYVDLDSPVRWSVQVPHPVADRDTERLGAELLRRARGGVLVVAGAHRKAGRGDEADVAHERRSVFHAIVEELAERGLPGIQVHGMADDSAPDHDVVASTGRGREAVREGRDLARALARRGYEVCRSWARSCPLEGRANVQGRDAKAQESEFLHVEFAPKMRTESRHRRAAVAALAEVTRDWRRH